LETLGESLEADLLQLRRDIAAKLARWLRLVIAHLSEQLAGSLRTKRHTAAEHFVKHYTQTVDVGASVDPVGSTGNLLRGHVSRSAGDDAELGAACACLIESEPEVYQYRASVCGHDNVRRLDVAVDDGPCVSVGKGIGQSRCDASRLWPGGPSLRQPSAKVGTIKKIGDYVNLPCLQPDIMD
jgi:hypothetical protein